MTTEPIAAAPAELALQRNDPSVGQMLSAVIERGITAENVAVITQLIALKREIEKAEAEKRFTAAFVALQADMPVLVAQTQIPMSGKYERFEDVMHVVGPLLVRHGFTVSFDATFSDGRVIETCQLRHVGGHSQSNSFAVRISPVRIGKDGKPTPDGETRADCKASTTAKRYALQNALNIVIRQDALASEDNDATLEGAPLTPAKAIYLREQCAELGVDVAKFLAFAGAASFETIPGSNYDRLVAMLAKKRAGGAKP